MPLEADLRARARALKLRIEPLDETLALDLRKEIDRGRSVLLHRLGVLDIGWGEVTDDLVRCTGTFRETWALRWRPELAVAIIDAALWGTTVGRRGRARSYRRAAGRRRWRCHRRGGARAAGRPARGARPVLRALDESAATRTSPT